MNPVYFLLVVSFVIVLVVPAGLAWSICAHLAEKRIQDAWRRGYEFGRADADVPDWET